jgi:DDE family transposase
VNEGKRMYADLMNLLLPILPSTIYHDVRRVQTLAWALVGICMTQTVRLGAWAEVVDSRAQLASSRVRRFARWLHQGAISPKLWYEPLLLQALRDWKLPSRVYVALDTTALTPFVLIRASLIYEGRAIPLAWRAIRQASTKVSFEDYQPVLEQVRTLLPAHLIVTLLADRGFVHAQLVRYTHDHDWHFRIRLTGNIQVHQEGHPVCLVKQLCPSVGEARCVHNVRLLGQALGPVHLVLTCPDDHPDDPWLLASDEPTDLSTLDEYAFRFDIEETFLDEKSGGFQLESSELACPEALERLMLIVALATVHFLSTGLFVVRAKLRRWVDTHWDRGLSYFKIGWRWLRQQYRRQWPSFPSFWIDPSPDRVPVSASRRKLAAKRKRQWVTGPSG